MATDFKATGTYSDGTYRYLHIVTGDLDGDGSNDDGALRLACSGGAVSSAWIYAPRDAATGMATGKRQHASVSFVKEWGPSTPQMSSWNGGYNVKSQSKRSGNWDLATLKGGRSAKTMALDDWSEVTVTRLDQACSAGMPSSVVANPLYQEPGMSGTNPVVRK